MQLSLYLREAIFETQKLATRLKRSKLSAVPRSTLTHVYIHVYMKSPDEKK